MTNIDELELLPEQYFVGKQTSLSRFLNMAQNTKRLDKVLSFWIDGPISILYNINQRNSTVNWKGSKYSEIVIIQVPVRQRAIWREDIRNLYNSIQRCILYPVIVILSHDDSKTGETYYKVCVNEIHHGVSKEISVMDTDAYSKWSTIEDLRYIFAGFTDQLASRTTYEALLQELFNNCYAYRSDELYDEAYYQAELESGLFESIMEAFPELLAVIGEQKLDNWAYGEITDFDASMEKAVRQLGQMRNDSQILGALTWLEPFHVDDILALRKLYIDGVNLDEILGISEWA